MGFLSERFCISFSGLDVHNVARFELGHHVGLDSNGLKVLRPRGWGMVRGSF